MTSKPSAFAVFLKYFNDWLVNTIVGSLFAFWGKPAVRTE